MLLVRNNEAPLKLFPGETSTTQEARGASTSVFHGPVTAEQARLAVDKT